MDLEDYARENAHQIIQDASVQDGVLGELRELLHAQRRRLEDFFHELDVDGDGHVSKNEFFEGLRHAMPNVNTEQWHYLQQSFDADGDGNISLEEFQWRFRLADWRQQQELLASFHQALWEDRRSPEEIFYQFDINRDGVLSHAEFYRAVNALCHRVGVALTEREALALMHSIDTDTNGNINWIEWINRFRSS